MLRNNALPVFLAFLMKWEGGCTIREGETPAAAFERARPTAWSNHADDPGGPTMMGITLRVYNLFITRYLSQPEATAAELRAMSYDRWEHIVTTLFWRMMEFNYVPYDCLALAYADDFFNSGRAAIRDMQRALCCLPDGILGPKTKGAMRHRVRTREEARDTCNTLLDLRLQRLQTLHHWPIYGRGWTRRIDDLRALIPSLDLTDEGL
ncbi:MAG: hypothetical protein IJS59_00200 [Bacteroidaceae bacterium]|nr:hypothetical protein [Bacteroidaceae bacterium]